MHYKNGRPAKNGDKVIVIPSNGAPYAGILYDACPGNDYCNGRVAMTSPSDPYPNLKECVHAEDAAAAPDTTPDSPSPCPAATVAGVLLALLLLAPDAFGRDRRPVRLTPVPIYHSPLPTLHDRRRLRLLSRVLGVGLVAAARLLGADRKQGSGVRGQGSADPDGPFLRGCRPRRGRRPDRRAADRGGGGLPVRVWVPGLCL